MAIIKEGIDYIIGLLVIGALAGVGIQTFVNTFGFNYPNATGAQLAMIALAGTIGILGLVMIFVRHAQRKSA